MTLDDVRAVWPDSRVIPDRVLSGLLDRHAGDVAAAAADWHGAPVELVDPDPRPRPRRPRRIP